MKKTENDGFIQIAVRKYERLRKFVQNQGSCCSLEGTAENET
jgi:hypothetical protein